MRLQNVLRALVANKKSYPPVSQMHSFETFTMRVADHEGWADEMQDIWEGYMGDYRERITEDSPLVEYVRRWIGMAMKSNAGRWARAGEIYADLQKAYGQDFTNLWRSSAVFGKRIKENKPLCACLESRRNHCRATCYTSSSLRRSRWIAAVMRGTTQPHLAIWAMMLWVYQKPMMCFRLG